MNSAFPSGRRSFVSRLPAAWSLLGALLLGSPPAGAEPAPAAKSAPAAEAATRSAVGKTSTKVEAPKGAPTNPDAAVPGAAAPVPTAPPAPASGDEAFNTRVKTLEEQVIDLKEKIFRTKARLLLLQETVLGGDLSTGARAVLFHRNEMGSSFVLESVAYALDGAPIFTKSDTEHELDKREEFEIFNGRIVPGQHQVAVRLVYRGHGYGIFSYLEGYKFKVQSSYTFNAEAAKVTTLKVVGFEKGGMTSDLKDRPAVRYDVEVSKDTAGPQSPAAAAAAQKK